MPRDKRVDASGGPDHSRQYHAAHYILAELDEDGGGTSTQNPQSCYSLAFSGLLAFIRPYVTKILLYSVSYLPKSSLLSRVKKEMSWQIQP